MRNNCVHCPLARTNNTNIPEQVSATGISYPSRHRVANVVKVKGRNQSNLEMTSIFVNPRYWLVKPRIEELLSQT